jgi:hypothetical protein
VSKPVVTRDGERWTYVWPDAGIAITLDRVRENSTGVNCECLIEGKLDPNGSDDKYRHITRRNLNLLASSTRKTFAGQLMARTEGRIPESQWENWIEVASETTVRQLREGEPFMDLTEVEAEMEPRYLVEHLLPENETTIIAGDGEVGKGWFAMSVAIAVLEGFGWIPNVHPVRPGRVLYLDWETGHQEIRRRQAWVERGLGCEHSNHLIYRHMSRGASDELDLLRKYVRENQIDLTIVDSLGPATADELEAAHAAIRVMGALRELPCTRMVLAHVSKAIANAQNGRARTMGSIQFDNQARSMWEMRKEEGASEIALYHRKSNIGPHQETIVYRQVWNDQDHTFKAEATTLSDTVSLQEFTQPRERVRLAIDESDRKRMTVKELATRVGLKEDTLARYLRRWPEFVNFTPKGGSGKEAYWGIRAVDGYVATGGNPQPM